MWADLLTFYTISLLFTLNLLLYYPYFTFLDFLCVEGAEPKLQMNNIGTGDVDPYPQNLKNTVPGQWNHQIEVNPSLKKSRKKKNFNLYLNLRNELLFLVQAGEI